MASPDVADYISSADRALKASTNVAQVRSKTNATSVQVKRAALRLAVAGSRNHHVAGADSCHPSRRGRIIRRCLAADPSKPNYTYLKSLQTKRTIEKARRSAMRSGRPPRQVRSVGLAGLRVRQRGSRCTAGNLADRGDPGGGPTGEPHPPFKVCPRGHGGSRAQAPIEGAGLASAVGADACSGSGH